MQRASLRVSWDRRAWQSQLQSCSLLATIFRFANSLELLIRNEAWQAEDLRLCTRIPRPSTVPFQLPHSCLTFLFSLPGLNGLELQKRIAMGQTDMLIIFITGHMR
jgi:FixJ family two-component response regulator